MTLEQYFKQSTRGRARSSKQGKISEWLDFCTFTLKGPQFLIVDVAFLPSKPDGLLVKSPPGQYRVQAKGTAYGTDRRVSRLRAFQEGSTGILGEQIGEAWTDTARTAFCDFKVFAKAWGKDDEASFAKIETMLDEAENQGVAVLDKAVGAVAPFVPSGFGDGSFPVFELTQKGKRVGFEIEFIADNAPYPFGRKATPTATGKSEADSAEPNWMSNLFEQLGQALQEKKKAGKKEKKAEVTEVFKRFEEQLLFEAQAATAEFREHLRQVRMKACEPRMHFRALADDPAFHTPQAQALIDQFREAGFEPAGFFALDGPANAKIAGFVHPKLRINGALNFSVEGLSCDLSAEYEDGTSIVATDNTKYSWIRQPPWKTTHRQATESLQELLDFLLSKLPSRKRAAVSVDLFAQELMPELNRYLDWRDDTGGFTIEEYRALARQKKPDRSKDAEWLQERRNEAVEKALFRWLLSQPNLEFQPKEVMDSLVIVHDELSRDLLLTAYWSGSGDFKAREKELAEGAPREAFAGLNTARGSKLRLVAAKSTGLAADYYLPAG
jgi:hypothetical protein